MIAAAGLLLIVALSPIYACDLGGAPVAMVSDEANFGSQAASLAHTGRDLNGAWLPLFLRINDPLTPDTNTTIWYQPFLFYAIAATLKVLPLAEWSIRMPNALMAVADIWLVYAIGRRTLNRRSSAILAALLFGLMPAHIVMSRRALDYVCPLPFALMWYLCVLRYRDTRHLRDMAIAGISLGVGLYSYIAAWSLMPFLLLITPLTISGTGPIRRAALTAFGAFSVPVLLLVPWLISHPDTLATVARYREAAGDPLAVDLAYRIAVYWNYFSPSFLFFSGGVNLPQAGIGVLPLSMLVLLPVGIYELLRRRGQADLALIAVVLFAPVPIALVLPDSPQHTIARAMIALPFLALIAAHGAEQLMTARHRAMRALAVLLIVAVPLQTGRFVVDYFTDYQVRTARLSDPVNVSAVAGFLVSEDARESIPAIYFPNDVRGAAWLWKFLTLKVGRSDLWARTREFDPRQIDAEPRPARSLFVTLAKDVEAGGLSRREGYSVATIIAGVDGDAATIILRKDR